MMSPRWVFPASSHATSDVTEPRNQHGLVEDGPIVIADDMWVGANLVVLPGRQLDKGSILGAGAVIADNVPRHTIAAGNPAVVAPERVRPATGLTGDESGR